MSPRRSGLNCPGCDRRPAAHTESTRQRHACSAEVGVQTPRKAGSGDDEFPLTILVGNNLDLLQSAPRAQRSGMHPPCRGILRGARSALFKRLWRHAPSSESASWFFAPVMSRASSRSGTRESQCADLVRRLTNIRVISWSILRGGPFLRSGAQSSYAYTFLPTQAGFLP